MYSKVGLSEETKGGGREGKIVNNNEAHHICVGTDTTKHTKKQHKIGRKCEEVHWRGVRLT
jgi:hypothetical protein